jgi:hypothetical protein
MTFFSDNHQVFPVGNDSSIVSNRSLQQFVLNAVTNSFTFDFNNYDYILSHQLNKYFTKSASDKIKNFFDKKYVPQIIKNKQFFNVSVISSFIIGKAEMGYDSANSWRLQVPAIINIYNGIQDDHSNIKLQMIVKMTGTDKNPYGMEITDIQMINSWKGE